MLLANMSGISETIGEDVLPNEGKTLNITSQRLQKLINDGKQQ